MASNPESIGQQYGAKTLLAGALRLSDVGSAVSTDYAEIITGDGVPAGGYGRDSGATMVYIRQDAAGATTALYVTADGGTGWTAMTGTSPAASAVTVADAAGYTTAADVEAALAELEQLRMVELADPGDAAAIPVTQSADIGMTTGAAGETGTLADPTVVGMTLSLHLDTDGGGDRVITAASALDKAGDTIMTFAAAGDSVQLLSVRDGAASYAWRVQANDGVTLS